jgi:outer membrane receptor protein involved in Fe transport
MAIENTRSQRFAPNTLTAAISAICAGAPVAFAQEAAQDESQDAGESLTIEEILVTATKRGALSLQDVPMSITAFTNEDIDLQGFKKLDDYAGQIPSLSFGRREPGGTNVIIRGCITSAISFGENPTTSVYLDEQPISNTGFNPDPRLVDIERVEALAGPQGTLFGEASQCGTLRIITNKPDTSGFSSYVDITGETIDGGNTGHEVSAMVNMPLIEDKLALRLVGFTADDAAWVDNVLGTSPGGTFDNAPYVKDDINESETSGARISLRWTPGDNWTFDAQAIFQDTEADGFGDVDLAEGVYAGENLGKWEQLRFHPETWSDEWYQLSLSAEGSLGWADMTVTASLANRETRYVADSTAYVHTFQQINDYVRAYYNPYANNYDFGGDPHAFSIDEQDWDMFSFEARLATPADSDSRWSGIAGVFYNKVESGPQSFTANVFGLSDNCDVYYLAYAEDCVGQFKYASYLHYYYFGTLDKLSDNWWHGVYETNLEQKAVFGEITYDVSENLAITLGGRWYDIETDRISRNGTLIEPPQTIVMNCGTQANRDAWQINGRPVSGYDTCYANEFGAGTESGFVPKFNATYTLDPDKMVYFTYSEGFRSGGVNSAKPASLFGAGGDFHTYESDTLLNYEFGTKTTWADGRFQLNVTAFHMVWEDIQIEAVDPEATFYSNGILNFPEAEIDGVEVDFSWLPSRNLSISGTLGYNDASLSETATLFAEGPEPKVAVAGTRLPIVPEWKGSLMAEYTLDRQVLGAEPYLLGVYHYLGDSVNSLEGIASIIADKAVRTHPSYSTFNLRFGLEGDDWSASVYVDNLFDEYGFQLYNDRWTKTRLTTNRPRTIGINFRKSWN